MSERTAVTGEILHSSDETYSQLCSRIGHSAKMLLELIQRFPSEVPHPDASGIDVEKLLNQIRSRYKMLCALVGARPSLRASLDASPAREQLDDDRLSTARHKRVWTFNAEPSF